MAISTPASVSVETASAPLLDVSRLYREGMVAGMLGAATVAVWFLLLDTLSGRPLWTPSVLGSALFRRGGGLDTLATLPVSLEMVLMFTWVHGLAFAALGGVAARLLGHVERHPGSGFGVLLFFVVFQFGFTAAATVFAAPVLHALPPWTVLVANLLAAAAMATYLRQQHPGLRVSP